jgi:glycosyltransferase involved in cell wall biosynthesis
MTDLTEIPHINTISAIQKSLESENVGIVGGKLLFPDETIYHVGIDFVLQKDPTSNMAWNWGARDDSIEIAGVTHRLQGFTWKDARTSKEIEVPAVSKALFGVTKQVYQKTGGFNESFTMAFFDIDFCLRVSQELNLKVIYNPSAVALYNDKKQAESEYNIYDDFIVKADNLLFNKTWGAYVKSIVESKYELPENFTLVWNMECGTGQVLGFTSEAINFVMALHERVKVKLEVGREDDCKNELRKAGIPLVVRNTIYRLSKREIPKNGDVVTVIHRDPGRYNNFMPMNPVEYVIGRSMYETDRIPSDWLSNCNSWKIDKIWVPTEFNRKTFSDSGVNSTKLDVIPELVDTDHFNPAIHSALYSITQEEGPFKFLSVMKWEPRKAWDVLLRAYFDEFRGDDNSKVVLYFMSRLDTTAKELYDKFVEDYIKEKELEDNESLPKVILLNTMFPETKLPSLYKSVDCLVVPSHGEGWGLPLVEAMAMSLPVIATNWSGPTAFMNADNSFLVSVSGLESATTMGHQWATPDLSSLKSQMRLVFKDSNEVAKRSKQARKDIVEKFSLGAVGNIVISKLKEIQEKLPANRIKKQSDKSREDSIPPTWYNTNPPSWTSSWGTNMGGGATEFTDKNGKKKYRIKINNNV